MEKQPSARSSFAACCRNKQAPNAACCFLGAHRHNVSPAPLADTPRTRRSQSCAASKRSARSPGADNVHLTALAVRCHSTLTVGRRSKAHRAGRAAAPSSSLAACCVNTDAGTVRSQLHARRPQPAAFGAYCPT